MLLNLFIVTTSVLKILIKEFKRNNFYILTNIIYTFEMLNAKISKLTYNIWVMLTSALETLVKDT
jgi:hypothetical protein